MSKLIVKGHRGKQYKLNCTQFRSPMGSQITTVQTKKMLHHFPIRAGQPDINFTVIFRSQDDHHEFNAFVRDHQINAQSEGYDGAVTLWWPERNIENWTGFIVEYKVMERGVREPAPIVTFGVALVESLMSEYTRIASGGASFWSIIGPQIPYTGEWGADGVILRPPTPPSSQDPDTSSPSGGGFTPGLPDAIN